MGESQYAAVTGDLVASRRTDSASRAEIQKETLKVLTELNQKLGDSLARPAVLTAGDEVQALFLRPSQTVEFMQEILDRLFGAGEHGQEIVFGVGWGALSTGLLPEATSVEQLDGPCFHHARETLAQAKKRKCWAVFRGFGKREDKTLTSLFELMGAIRSGWTATQSLNTVEVRKLGRRIDVAREREVSPSVITESLQQSHFEAILHGEETARDLLKPFDPPQAGTATEHEEDHER